VPIYGKYAFFACVLGAQKRGLARVELVVVRRSGNAHFLFTQQPRGRNK